MSIRSILRADFVDTAPFQHIVGVSEADDLPSPAIVKQAVGFVTAVIRRALVVEDVSGPDMSHSV
jgi:hypothetical protein